MYYEYSIHWEVELYKYCKTRPVGRVIYAQLCYWLNPGSTQLVSVRFDRFCASGIFCVVSWAWASDVSTIELGPISPICQVGARIVSVV